MTATLRWLAGTRITSAVPCVVIEDSPEAVALFQPGGSIGREASGVRTGPRGRNMLSEGWDGTHAPVEWLGLGVLRVHRYGRPWSVWRWLDTARRWSDDFYVNLEDPWRRASIGFDSGDWILDIVVRADGGWQYKDQDELAWAESTGAVSAEWATRVRSAASTAVADVESRAWPFDADWDRWLPPTTLTLPVLSPEWAVVGQSGSGA